MAEQPRRNLPWWRSPAMRETGLLLLLALLPALLAAGWHPRRPDLADRAHPVPELTLAAARQLPATAVWVDARSREAFARGHIPEAISLNEDEWETRLGDFVARWQPDAPVVVYCDRHECQSSQQVARRLRRELGVESVYVLQGGWQSWAEARR